MKRHPLDLFSLITGLTFVSVAVLYLLDASGRLHVNGRLVIPLLLIALGVAGLASAIQRMARGQRSAASAGASGSAAASGPGSTGSTAPAGSADAGGFGGTRGAVPAGTSSGSRYDDLSTDLAALGLLDDEPDDASSDAPGEPTDRA